jgi:elongation factor Ts
LSCESDFVARNELFDKLTADVAGHALRFAGPHTHESAQELNVDALRQDAAITSALGTALTTLRENISLRRATVLGQPNGVVGGYLHNNGTFAALVAARLASNSKDTAVLAKAGDLCARVAQHIVAVDPGMFGDGLRGHAGTHSARRLMSSMFGGVGSDRAWAALTPGDNSVLDKVLQTPYVFDGSKTVARMLQEESRKAGVPQLELTNLVRWVRA